MNTLKLRLLYTVCAALTAAACSRQKHIENGLEFRDWILVKPRIAGSGTVAYGSIRNTSASARLLKDVELACAESAELHETLTDGGRARMAPLGAPTIAAGETLVFEPGHKHIMVMRSKPDIGEKCDAVFTFDTATARFAMPVREREK